MKFRWTFPFYQSVKTLCLYFSWKIHINEYIIYFLKADLNNITVLWISNAYNNKILKFLTYFKIKQSQIGRMELKLLKFHKWTHKKIACITLSVYVLLQILLRTRRLPKQIYLPSGIYTSSSQETISAFRHHGGPIKALLKPPDYNECIYMLQSGLRGLLFEFLICREAWAPQMAEFQFGPDIPTEMNIRFFLN